MDLENKTYYKTSDVAKMLELKPRTIRDWIKSGKVKAEKIVKSWFIHRDEVKKLLGVK